VILWRYLERKRVRTDLSSRADENNVRLDEDSGISHVLPFEVAGSLGRYYRHVVALFVEHGVDAAVVKFARLAIEVLAEEGIEEENVEKDLWLKLFRSNAALGLYEEAYTTLMTAPHDDTCVSFARFSS
jgi:nuclear pore complex protein Nup160